MDDDGTKVVDRTWDAVNSEDTAKADEQFALYQGIEEYTTYDSWETEGNKIMPCRAVLDFGEQISEDNEIFGTYNITIGARFYEDEESTEFYSLPQQVKQIDFGAPTTDLESVYEVTGDAAAEDVSEEVVYFKKTKRFQVDNVFTGGENYGGKGWMHIAGGYKLYDSGANKWFYRFAAELPATVADAMTDKVFYFWVKYTAVDAEFNELNGAVACKTQVGEPYWSEAFQWYGEVNMSSDSDDVAGKRWYRQNANSVSSYPDFYAPFWNDAAFAMVDSPRTTGNYKKQFCELQLDVEDIEDISFTMQAGLRIYADDDAQEFYTTPEPKFNYFQEEMEYTDDLEVVPVYAPEKQKAEPKEVKTYTVDIADITAAFGTDAINQWEIDYLASLEPETNTNVARSWRQTVPDPEVSITASYGYTKYEELTESDWMYWYVAVEMPTSFATDGEILYTYLTIDAGTETEEIMTAGCQTAFGSSDYALSIFTHGDDADALSSTNADYVIGQTIDAQADDLEEEDSDHSWLAGLDYNGGLAPESEDSLYTNYACYFVKEEPKIGRDDTLFDRDVSITIGARIYADTSVTEFTDLAEVSDTLFIDEIGSYSTKTGAAGLLVSTMATVMLLFTFAF